MKKTINRFFHSEKVKFIIVGFFNTLLDFSIYYLLTALNYNPVLANYISSGIALIVSYFLNRKFTFASNNSNYKSELIKYFTVTLTGIWLIQPLVINLVVNIIGSSQPYLVAAKILATVFSLIWNFMLYKNFVFKKNN